MIDFPVCCYATTATSGLEFQNVADKSMILSEMARFNSAMTSLFPLFFNDNSWVLHAMHLRIFTFSGPTLSSDTEKVAKNSEPSFGVTIITSYLGASNSTLINCVLNPQHGKRIEVISNEFGVERTMINERRGVALAEEVVELANDRICCIAKHGLVQAREQLIQRRSGEITC
uniref:CobW/HypB/UreG nucleotide-binding domain-containing protein n=1 Tax=Kalanchoe fedtschenkoi TaxID=63787 RepID=A0A7N0U5N8_KALFE